MLCKRAHSLGVIYRRSHPIIGIWVVVIATKDGAVLDLFTLTPEALNWMMVLQMSRFSPLQFHSNFCRLEGKSNIRGIQLSSHWRCRSNSSRFCLMKVLFQPGNLLRGKRACDGSAARH